MLIDHRVENMNNLKYPEMNRLMLSHDVCCNPKCICSSHNMVSKGGFRFSFTFPHFLSCILKHIKKLIYFTSLSYSLKIIPSTPLSTNCAGRARVELDVNVSVVEDRVRWGKNELRRTFFHFSPLWVDFFYEKNVQVGSVLFITFTEMNLSC